MSSETNPSSAPYEKPLSPHLGIYSWPLNMAMSILHRATGIALSIGLIALTWLLVAAASGPESYNQFMEYATHPLGQVFLLGWTLALYFHLFSGIRHLIWDTGKLFKLRNAKIGGIAVLLATLVFTAITWWPKIEGLLS
ncbi:MAG: succinate dehydrogenase, cytochrome b556 subunit [Alphaproteobacteria bacterium]|nr:succinate dehydrogenase, cytochrome b556 subunit [Alphaproteobacteria bacterium]|tara:strand:- start:43 stop:459 length:417 start_codon:yes stop_codon:yes gene_type:complete